MALGTRNLVTARLRDTAGATSAKLIYALNALKRIQDVYGSECNSFLSELQTKALRNGVMKSELYGFEIPVQLCRDQMRSKPPSARHCTP